MEQILVSIGAFGRYQQLSLFFIGLISALTAMTIYSTIFTANQPNLLCNLKNESETNAETREYAPQSQACEIWRGLAKSNKSNTPNNYSLYYECKIDDSYFYSFVNEWEFICDKSYLATLTQTLYMVGRVCGMFIGFFADKYGRKKCAITLCSFLCVVLSSLEILQMEMFGFSITTKFVIYCVGQFLIGAIAKALYLVVYILLVEITTAKYQTIVSNINLYMYVVGELFVLVEAYYYRNWHILNRTMAFYSMVAIFIIGFFLQESPRFLLANERYEEAYKILVKIANFNKKSTEGVSMELELEEHSKILNEQKEEDKNDSVSKVRSNFAKIWSPRSNLIKTCAFLYIWLALHLVYYGISLGITNIDSQVNSYLMYMLSSLAEIAGYVSCHLNDKFGRKRTLIFFLISSGIVCLVAALLPSSIKLYIIIIKITFVSIGKAMASAAFNSCYIYNSLLYPTTVRSTIVLFASNFGGIGSFIAPQINLLQTFVWKPLPYLIFSGSSFLAAVCVIFLQDPEKTKFM